MPETRMNLYQTVLDLMMDYIVGDTVGHEDKAAKPTREHLDSLCQADEIPEDDWREKSIEDWLNEMRATAAAFYDGYESGRKSRKNKSGLP